MAGADWRSIISDQIAVKGAAARTHVASQHANISRVGFGVEAHPFVVQAARARGISVAAYIRRSTLGMVALDLGLELRDLLERDVAPSPYGSGGAEQRWGRGDRDLDGERFGSFAVRRG